MQFRFKSSWVVLDDDKLLPNLTYISVELQDWHITKYLKQEEVKNFTREDAKAFAKEVESRLDLRNNNNEQH